MLYNRLGGPQAASDGQGVWSRPRPRGRYSVDPVRPILVVPRLRSNQTGPAGSVVGRCPSHVNHHAGPAFLRLRLDALQRQQLQLALERPNERLQHERRGLVRVATVSGESIMFGMGAALASDWIVASTAFALAAAGLWLAWGWTR